MNNFGVVYMSTVGRGTIVGAPEGTKFVTKISRINVSSSSFMQLEKRTLHVSAPANSTVELYAANGKLAFSTEIGSNAAISLNKLPVGKYMARLKDASGKKLQHRVLVIK
jgi:hypothetical protein